MSRRTSRQSHQGPTTRCKAQIIVAVILVVSLFAAWTMLASSGALDGVFSQKSAKKGTVSTANFNSNSPSKEYIYVGGRLVATEEPTTASLSPPSALHATASSSIAGQIDLSWTASSGSIDHYQIERSSNFSSSGNGFSFVANVPSSPTSYSDTPPRDRCPRLYVSSACRRRF
jgi:isocitrate lyase